MFLPGVSPFSRMLKKSSSGVLAGHCRLSISAAFTSVPRFIQRGVNLRDSTYHRERAALAARGGWVRKSAPRPRHRALTDSRPSANVTLLLRRVADLAAALLDSLFEHPAVIPVLSPDRSSHHGVDSNRIFLQPAKSEAGFTLVEILIAVALLGMIGAMVFGSLVMTTNAVEAGREHAAKEQAVRRILRLMAEEISLSKRTTIYPWVGTNATQDGQPADILAFLAISQELSTSAVKESETVRVVYTRERDRLIRFVRRNLYTLTDTNETLDQMELADRVQAFNIRYYDDQNRLWVDEWPAVPKIPKALLIEVTFQYPDAAPWTVREWVAIGTP
ncbi:MAG: hypothetical protein OJF51_005159 [Nitrospira sp.]|jgi:general secretion pathway protein J|nr:MAG: hypothetical protein OJF51_005159 [Nitrospira sp.]